MISNLHIADESLMLYSVLMHLNYDLMYASFKVNKASNHLFLYIYFVALADKCLVCFLLLDDVGCLLYLVAFRILIISGS